MIPWPSGHMNDIPYPLSIRQGFQASPCEYKEIGYMNIVPNDHVQFQMIMFSFIINNFLFISWRQLTMLVIESTVSFNNDTSCPYVSNCNVTATLTMSPITEILNVDFKKNNSLLIYITINIKMKW